MTPTPKDPVAAAIAASEPERSVEQHQQTTVTISSSGRHVVISYPVDMTDVELLEFTGWLTNQLRMGLSQERARRASGRIIVPVGALPT